MRHESPDVNIGLTSAYKSALLYSKSAVFNCSVHGDLSVKSNC